MLLRENKLGVMQGRLLPKYQGRYQAHPVGYWEQEFYLAADLGIDCIEFIVDYSDVELNPLCSDSGKERILSVVEKTSVSVQTICADYFMEAPLHSRNLSRAAESFDFLKKLLKNASLVGAQIIVIPCVDQSSLKNHEDLDLFIQMMTKIAPYAEEHGCLIALETDLPPGVFGELLNHLNSPIFTVNYDIGNSAALGYDPLEEISVYGDRISDVHIKDRLRDGGSVILGDGNADIYGVMKLLDEVGYRGPLIMQAFRDDEGYSIFRDQLRWIKSVLSEECIDE